MCYNLIIKIKKAIGTLKTVESSFIGVRAVIRHIAYKNGFNLYGEPLGGKFFPVEERIMAFIKVAVFNERGEFIGWEYKAVK